MKWNLLVGCLLTLTLFAGFGYAAAVDATLVSQSPDPAETGPIGH